MTDSDRAATTPTKTAGTVYAVDPRASQLTIRAFAGGLLSAFAHNPTFAVRRFTVEISFDPAAPERSSVKVVVDAASLELTDQVSESDRKEIQRIMRNEVLEVERFPTIEFQSARVEAGDTGGRYHVSITGPLTLHGAVREVTIDADGSTMGTMLRVHGEYLLRQSEFGIKPVSVAAQAIKVKDELKCVFDLVARPKDS
jgi:polyisoprenoid-binding protein YceI